MNPSDLFDAVLRQSNLCLKHVLKFEAYLKDRLCKYILTEEIIVMEYVLLFYGHSIVQIFKYLINVNYCIKIIGTFFLF